MAFIEEEKSICLSFVSSSDDEGEELFYKRGTEFKLPYPCLYDFDTNFTSTIADDETYALKHHSNLTKTANSNLLTSSTPATVAHHSSSSSSGGGNPRPKKVAKTTGKAPSINPFPSNVPSSTSSFDPYYNVYPTSYGASYPSDVTTASFIEAATTNYTSNGSNPNDLLLVNESNPYSGTYSNYYAAALQQQYQNSLAPYHAVYYPDTSNRYYPNHRASPTLNESAYHSQQQQQQSAQHQHHQQQQQSQSASTHENYLVDGNASNNPYSYYLYNKTPTVVASHGHDSNNNLSLFDVSLSSPIHHSVIKHCSKR